MTSVSQFFITTAAFVTFELLVKQVSGLTGKVSGRTQRFPFRYISVGCKNRLGEDFGLLSKYYHDNKRRINRSVAPCFLVVFLWSNKS